MNLRRALDALVTFTFSKTAKKSFRTYRFESYEPDEMSLVSFSFTCWTTKFYLCSWKTVLVCCVLKADNLVSAWS